MPNNIGKQGEQLFAQLMETKGYTVQNVSANPDYYYKGDFIVTSPTSGLTKIFECKFDTRINKTGNLYLEIRNKNSKAKDGLGWYEWCGADYLAYGNAQAKKFFIIPMDKLKERVEELPKRVAFCGDDSCGYLININQIIDLVEVL